MGAILDEAIKNIQPLDEQFVEQAWAHWDSRCKPLRGFGRLEEMVVQLAGVQQDVMPHADKRAVVIMGADNGVVAEGISQTSADVTGQVLENMGDRITSVCVMSKVNHADVFPINIGTNKPVDHPGVRNIPVRAGTGDIMKEPAMTREECIRAIEAGIEMVRELKEQGYDLILVGEMGIGNTTTSAACAAALFGVDAELVTGRGAGLSTPGLKHKVEVVREALRVNQPDPKDPIDILSKVGGLDIAGMTGCFIGAAAYRVGALIDGVISGISALLAEMIVPGCKDYLFATHATAEPAGKLTMEALKKEPILLAGMHLGEATGAAAVLPIFDLALNAYKTLPGFDEGNVEKYEHLK